MGCTVSVQPDRDRYEIVSSSLVTSDLQRDINLSTQYAEKYGRDPILPEKCNPDYYRLRAYLDSALGRAAIRKYCPPEYTVLLDIWADVMGYRRDGVDRKMRHQLGVAICKKYVVSTEWMKHCIDGIEVEVEGKVDKMPNTLVGLESSDAISESSSLLSMISRDECMKHFDTTVPFRKNRICSNESGCSFPLAAFDFLLKQIFMTIYAVLFNAMFKTDSGGAMSISSVSIMTSYGADNECNYNYSINKSSRPNSLVGNNAIENNDFGRDPKILAISLLNELVLRSDRELASKRVVSVDSFVYGRVLGRGTFGLVASCMRKQPGMGTNKGGTGTVFAMKLQEKEEMVVRCDEDRNRIVMERKILSDCDCPYINKLYCAIQTNKLSLMVLEYAEFGDLSGFIRANGLKYLPLDRVRFYIAELTSAVVYLHSHGIMHRDIKPGNMLLKKNGHIILGDFGSAVCSLVGTISNDFRFSVKEGSRSRNVVSVKATKYLKGPSKMRAHSIVGTSQYMAPEVAYLATMSIDRRASLESYYNYTNAVDWWSVGVTAYKLLTGCRPIEDYQMGLILQHYDFDGGVDDLIEPSCSYSASVGNVTSMSNGLHLIHESSTHSSNSRSKAAVHKNKSLENTPQRVSLNVDKIPDIAVQDFISELLDVNFITRLGSGAGGLEKVKKHDFFESIDWNLLDANQQDPPWVPDGEVLPAGTKPNMEHVGASMMRSISSFMGNAVSEKNTSINAPPNSQRSASEGKKHVLDFKRFLKISQYQKYCDTEEAETDPGGYTRAELASYFSKWNYSSTDCLLDEVQF